MGGLWGKFCIGKPILTLHTGSTTPFKSLSSVLFTRGDRSRPISSSDTISSGTTFELLAVGLLLIQSAKIKGWVQRVVGKISL
jgi:hypothetical protein